MLILHECSGLVLWQNVTFEKSLGKTGCWELTEQDSGSNSRARMRFGYLNFTIIMMNREPVWPSGKVLGW